MMHCTAIAPNLTIELKIVDRLELKQDSELHVPEYILELRLPWLLSPPLLSSAEPSSHLGRLANGSI